MRRRQHPVLARRTEFCLGLEASDPDLEAAIGVEDIPVRQNVTGIDAVLSGGRWFEENEQNAVLLPERMAAKSQ